MQTAAVPLLVIAPDHPRFRLWRREHGLSDRLALFAGREQDLRGTADRHVVIVDSHACPTGLLQLVRHRAAPARLTVHYSSTAYRAALSGVDLRARYGDQCELLPDVGPLLQMLGRDDVDPQSAIGCRYATLEALEAFAEGNRRHHGHEAIGPVAGPDGKLYGVTVLTGLGRGPGGKHDDAAAANTR
jgi:hypothetical protein